MMPRDISALSLAVGVCALRALAQLRVSGVALKWPNDLVVGAAKLGGILIELRAEAGGPASVVIGIGLNVIVGEPMRRRIASTGTEATDLVATGLKRPDRNRVAAALIGHVVAGVEQFERDGFAAFMHEWRAADALAGQRVVVSSDSGSVAGHARGIDAEGALCLQTRDGVQRFISGDVSARPVA